MVITVVGSYKNAVCFKCLSRIFSLWYGMLNPNF
jgi:hypothetical protein